MPKYFEFKIAGYYLYCTSHCIIEPIHAHASDKKLTEARSAKVWVKENGDTIIANKGNLTDKELAKIQRFIKKNIIPIKDKWKEFNGYTTDSQINFKQK